jgi:hypothetical protein
VEHGVLAQEQFDCFLVSVKAQQDAAKLLLLFVP